MELLRQWHWNPSLGAELWNLFAGIWIGLLWPHTSGGLKREKIAFTLTIYCAWPLLMLIWIVGTYLEYLEKKSPPE